MRYFRLAERGQALIIIVFAILGLVGVVGLAVDGGRIYADRIHAQNTADTTAMEAAMVRINNRTNWIDAAYQKAAWDGYNNDGVTNTVQVHSPPATGAYKGNIEYIQVIITSHVKMYLASAIGVREITNRVETVSRTKPSVYQPMMGGAAVVSLAPASDCLIHRAFWVHGEATLSVIDSGLFVNSANKQCALVTEANGSIRLQTPGKNIYVVGGADIKKPDLITPYPPDTNNQGVSYPPPFFMPKVGCQKEAEISKDGHTMEPGTYSDTFPPPGVHTLSPGVYCLDGDFILSSGQELDGNSVVIKVEHGRVQFASGADFRLGAPQAGRLAGLLMFLPPENHSKVQLNGGPDSMFKGAILAPAAEVHINGSDNGSGWHTQIIGYTVEVNGDSNVVIKYVDDQIYDALSMPEVQFIK